MRKRASTTAMSHEQSAMGHALRANDPFGRYKPEEKQEVRKQEVVGNRQEAIRKTREMLRSMTPEQALQIMEFHRDLNLLEALALAQREGKLIVPNDVHDRILMETRDKRLLDQIYGTGAVWTGTLVVYKAPDRKFGENITYMFRDKNIRYSISFKIPKQFKRKANCILVIEHPDFELVEVGKNKFEVKADESNINLIESFPKEDRRLCHIDERFRIPVEEPIPKSRIRELYRSNKRYIGPITREFNFFTGPAIMCYYAAAAPSSIALVPVGLENSDLK